MTNNTKQRRRLQFGIKTLLLVMLVSGLLVSWSINKVRRQREQLRFIKKLETSPPFFCLQVVTPDDFQGTSDHWLGQLFDRDYFDTIKVFSTDDPDSFDPDAMAGKLTILKDLRSINYHGMQLDLGCLSGLTKLENIEIAPLFMFNSATGEFDRQSAKISNAAALSHLTTLKDVRIKSLELEAPTFLARCRELEHLDLKNSKVESLEGLENCTQLRALAAGDIRVKDLSPIKNAGKLERLMLSDTSVSDLSPLSGASLLKKLVLARTDVSDLNPIRDSTQLEHLDASETKITSISALANSTQLSYVNLAGTNVKDLSPLRGHTNLEEIDLRGCTATDLSPLVGLKASIRLLLDQQIDPPHADLKRYISRGEL